jgi:hypothetical protein
MPLLLRPTPLLLRPTPLSPLILQGQMICQFKIQIRKFKDTKVRHWRFKSSIGDTTYTAAITAYTAAITAYTAAITAYTTAITAYTAAITAYTTAITAYTAAITNNATVLTVKVLLMAIILATLLVAIIMVGMSLVYLDIKQKQSFLFGILAILCLQTVRSLHNIKRTLLILWILILEYEHKVRLHEKTYFK